MIRLWSRKVGKRDKHATLTPWFSLAERYQLKIFKTMMTSAALLSAVFLLAGCGHGLINRLI
jgi:hypothetical protein